MPSTCCLRYPQQLKAAQLGGANCPLQVPWLLCSSVSTLCLYSVRSSLTPSFLLFFFCLSLLLLPLSPDMWRKTPLYRLGAKENCSDLGTKVLCGKVEIETQREEKCPYEFGRWDQKHKSDRCANSNYFAISRSTFNLHFISLLYLSTECTHPGTLGKRHMDNTLWPTEVTFNFLKKIFNSLKVR